MEQHTSDNQPRARVVDLAAYRASRPARQPSLFEAGGEETGVIKSLSSSLHPMRPLADRARAHREQMLRHLATAAPGRHILSS